MLVEQCVQSSYCGHGSGDRSSGSDRMGVERCINLRVTFGE